MKVISKIATGFFLLWTLSASAGSITYNIDRTVGAGGVTGSITTDGTIGALEPGNFIDWTITLDDGIDTFTLLGPANVLFNSQYVQTDSNLFFGSLTELTFDFSGDGAAIFQNPAQGSGINYWCLEGQDPGVSCASNGSGTENILVLVGNEYSAYSGRQVIGAVSEVPLPAAAWLFASALAGIALVNRRGSQLRGTGPVFS